VKYFTKQLWSDMQRSGELADEAHRRWETGLVAYRRELEALRGRVPPGAFEFFDKARPHDGRLADLRVQGFASVTPYRRDPAEATADGSVDEYWAEPSQLAVEVSVAERRSSVWTLRYSGIRRLVVDFPTEEPLFRRGQDFDDWGYDEFSDAGDGFLRHEVLFSSGATILVEFRDVSVERTERPRLPTTD
jgi:hypothetical protein